MFPGSGPKQPLVNVYDSTYHTIVAVVRPARRALPEGPGTAIRLPVVTRPGPPAVVDTERLRPAGSQPGVWCCAWLQRAGPGGVYGVYKAVKGLWYVTAPVITALLSSSDTWVQIVAVEPLLAGGSTGPAIQLAQHRAPK